ncbi:coiled-coil domain-containing protein 191-like [Paramacrobiotus metropolitanus]|uniref:coiled-coil domain-containing protein 191-like n=1 Tax=Paramacrobiotus metropolitanus TaxID=2943436 RepID=UPI0024456DE3|nr:coiled-coil domain-containing protein 191-like [Paramacrobiotus metropolitanus]
MEQRAFSPTASSCMQKSFVAWLAYCKASKSRCAYEKSKQQAEARISAITMREKDTTEKDQALTSATKQHNHAVVSVMPIRKNDHPSSDNLAAKSETSTGRSQPSSSSGSDRRKMPVDKRFADFQKRAEEREKRHAELKKLKEQQQAQEVALRRQAEEEARNAEIERKILAARERKERLEKERSLKQRKQQEAEMLRIKMALADSFRRKMLLLSYGMEPWKCLLRMQNQKRETAVAHHEHRLCANVVKVWCQLTQTTLNAKQLIADKMVERLWKSLIIRHLSQVQLWKKRLISRLSPFVRRFKQRRILLIWRFYLEDEEIYYQRITRQCENLFSRCTKVMVLEKWQTLPAVMKEQRLRNSIILQLCTTIQALLPDFSLSETFVEQWELQLTEPHKAISTPEIPLSSKHSNSVLEQSDLKQVESGNFL